MQPRTSYWPPTSSPAASFGVKSYAPPHFAQKPLVRPGRPSRERPTCAPHLEQYRLCSGTCGSARTASPGSRYSTSGISTRPRPRPPRPVEREPLVVGPLPREVVVRAERAEPRVRPVLRPVLVVPEVVRALGAVPRPVWRAEGLAGEAGPAPDDAPPDDPPPDDAAT